MGKTFYILRNTRRQAKPSGAKARRGLALELKESWSEML